MNRSPATSATIETYKVGILSWQAQVRFYDGKLWATRYGMTEKLALAKAEAFLAREKNIDGVTQRNPHKVYR